jgi:hypothetical protein
MATKTQIEANRINAQRSTGPRTDRGKAITRQNALRHGLCAGIPGMHDETEEEIQELLTTLREEHEPVGATEEILVYKIAEHFFYGKRASYLLSEQLEWKDKGSENTREIGLMLRYHTTADRGYYRALTELRKVQKERWLQEIGSVSQNALQPEPPAEKVPEKAAQKPATTPEAKPDGPAKPAPHAPPAEKRPSVPYVTPKSIENYLAGKQDYVELAVV